MDDLDRQIMQSLQLDARRKNVDLAKDLGVAPSTMLERIRRLEERGYLNGFRAIVNPAKLGLTEPESDVDPTYYSDARGEAIWDTMITWVLPAAGILILLNNPLWAYFGLVGGGIYLYFAGRGIAQRLEMQRRGIRIGKPKSVGAAFVFLFLWGLIGLITIIIAVAALPLP